MNKIVAYAKKNTDAQKGLVCVAKHVTVMILNQTILSLTANASIKERLKTVMMILCPSNANF